MRGNASIIWRHPPQIEMVLEQAPKRSTMSGISGFWNGPLLRVIHFSETEVKVVRSSYEKLVQARLGEDATGPLFLAVSGVARVGNGFVLGKRAREVSAGGVWEFAPAGGVQDLPVEEQLLNETVEELFVRPRDVEIGQLVAMYVDSEAFTADLIIPMSLNMSEKELYANFIPTEYEEIAVVNGNQLTEFLSKNSPKIFPVTQFIASLIDQGEL